MGEFSRVITLHLISASIYDTQSKATGLWKDQPPGELEHPRLGLIIQPRKGGDESQTKRQFPARIIVGYGPSQGRYWVEKSVATLSATKITQIEVSNKTKDNGSSIQIDIGYQSGREQAATWLMLDLAPIQSGHRRKEEILADLNYEFSQWKKTHHLKFNSNMCSERITPNNLFQRISGSPPAQFDSPNSSPAAPTTDDSPSDSVSDSDSQSETRPTPPPAKRQRVQSPQTANNQNEPKPTIQIAGTADLSPATVATTLQERANQVANALRDNETESEQVNASIGQRKAALEQSNTRKLEIKASLEVRSVSEGEAEVELTRIEAERDDLIGRAIEAREALNQVKAERVAELEQLKAVENDIQAELKQIAELVSRQNLFGRSHADLLIRQARLQIEEAAERLVEWTAIVTRPTLSGRPQEETQATLEVTKALEELVALRIEEKRLVAEQGQRSEG